jgi:hypothetical protein
MRTIIDVPETQLEALDAWCRLEGVSRAEAIRRAVDVLLERHRAGKAKPAFGLWRGRGIDGLKYQRDLRREWDR